MDGMVGWMDSLEHGYKVQTLKQRWPPAPLFPRSAKLQSDIADCQS